MSKQAKYLALDLETTGLDPRWDRIIEAAAICVSEDFSTANMTINMAVWQHPTVLEGCGALEMHMTSGLINKRPDGELYVYGGQDMGDVEAELCRLVEENFESAPIPIGHSFKFDRDFLAHWMPRFYKMLHYRTVDSRSIEEAMPSIPWPKGDHRHRAMSDARRSLEIARIARLVGEVAMSHGFSL